MKFITLHDDDGPIIVNTGYITCVLQDGTGSHIYLLQDESPLEVNESVDAVLRLLR